jgi:hypothetical protein
MRLLGWALRPDSEPRYAPRVGFTAGVHLGAATWADERPLLGLRAGVRVRLFEHLGLVAELGWENSVTTRDWTPGLSAPGRFTRLDINELSALVGVELFSTSAFKPLFAPELSIIAMAGLSHFIIPEITPLQPPQPIEALFGVRLQLLRLWPSRWWFPVYVQLMFDAYDGRPQVRSVAAGIGI